MPEQLLKAFWIATANRRGPLGFGVTAWSLDDAFQIIKGMGYELPEDVNHVKVIEGVRVADLDQNHVVANMGPIVVRGLWYPFVTIGVPAWLVDKGVLP